LVLKTIVDREIPAALKRLSESEDSCLKASEALLSHSDEIAVARPGLIDALAKLPEGFEDAKVLEDLAGLLDRVSKNLNVVASFGDLVGQRLIKTIDFLESALPIVQEIIEEYTGPEKNKASREKTGQKWANEPADRRPAQPNGDHFGPKKAGKTPKALAEEAVEADWEKEGHPPMETNNQEPKKPATGEKLAKPKKMKKAQKAGELFGPDDDGLTQEEVTELVNKLVK
jgi:hypothetical protein